MRGPNGRAVCAAMRCTTGAPACGATRLPVECAEAKVSGSFRVGVVLVAREAEANARSCVRLWTAILNRGTRRHARRALEMGRVAGRRCTPPSLARRS